MSLSVKLTWNWPCILTRAPSGVGDKPFATFVRYTKHGHGDVSGTMTSWISSGSPEDIQYVIVYLKF